MPIVNMHFIAERPQIIRRTQPRRTGTDDPDRLPPRRPDLDRLDPPRRLLTQALEIGCVFTIDSDAHAPGQLDWLQYGCDRAEKCEVPPDRAMNTKSAEELMEWVA